MVQLYAAEPLWRRQVRAALSGIVSGVSSVFGRTGAVVAANGDYTATTSGDGYVYVNGGNLVMGTQTVGKTVSFHVGGTLSTNIEATIDLSGINLAAGNDYRINNVSMTGLIANTGQAAWLSANGAAGNLSGNLTTTGTTLTNQINLVSGLMVSGTLEQKPQFSIAFNSSSITWTAMPAAATFFNNTGIYISWADLTAYTGVSLVVSKLLTASAASGTLFLKYSSNPAQTFSNYLDLCNPPQQLGINVTNTMINSGFRPIVAGAKSGIYIAICGSGGNAVLAPMFGMVTAVFK